MSYFKERLQTKPTVTVLEQCLPDVIINSNALVKMQLYVDKCDDEIGWLGTAYKQKNTIYVEDVYLFEQEVHSTTTEITPEGLSKFGEELLKQDNGIEIWNNLKVWGHSHVNMSTSSSGQDDKQMETFANNGHDWFVRIIANKKGEMQIDLYDYSQGIIYKDLPWEEAMSEEEQHIQEQIALLYQKIADMKKIQLEKFEKQIKDEMKEKVSKKTYSYQGQYYRKGGQIGYTSNYYANKYDKDDDDKVVVIHNGKKNEIEKNTNANFIEDESDIHIYFTEGEIMDIGEARFYAEASSIIDQSMMNFTYADKHKIWEYCKRYTENVYFGIIDD